MVTSKGSLFEKKQKELLKMERRLNELYKAQRAIPLILLPKPVRYGWERSYVVRDDIRKSRQFSFYDKLLSKLNTYVISKRKDFKSADWKTGKLKDVEQNLKFLDEKEYSDLTEQENRFFTRVILKFKRWYGVQEKVAFVFNKPYVYVFKVKPYFITHERAKDGEIESEITYIKGYLWVNMAAYKYGLYSRGRHYYEDKIKRKNRITKKLIKEEIEALYSE